MAKYREGKGHPGKRGAPMAVPEKKVVPEKKASKRTSKKNAD